MASTDLPDRPFPTSAGVLLGLGLGGFFDGIVLHQVLQWHHMISTPVPPVSVPDLQLNVLWDGFFHVVTYIFTALGLYILWRTSRIGKLRWNWKLLPGTLLMGHGIFNLTEGIIDHHLLELHHVNELVSPQYWIYWDIGFLLWGASMLIGGWYLLSAARRETPEVVIAAGARQVR
jgi:uncharacterized membrane protein